MKDLKIKDLSSLILYWDKYEQIEQIESDLQEKLSQAQDPLQREEMYYLLLIVRMKKYSINNILIQKNLSEYKKIVNEWIVIYDTKKQLKSTSKMKVIFIRTVLSHISFIKKFTLWDENDFTNHLKYFENELKLQYYKLSKKYYLLIRQLWYKYFVWYGIWYKEIFLTTVFVWLFFWLSYYLYDTITANGTLISWVDVFAWQTVGSFDYYLYLSINILSNLWADSNLATTFFLRILFGMEQVLWVMILWVYIFMIWKKI
jgi:hypothetical protein